MEIFCNGKGKITRKCRIDYDKLIILVCIFKDNREFSPIGKAERQAGVNKQPKKFKTVWHGFRGILKLSGRVYQANLKLSAGF